MCFCYSSKNLTVFQPKIKTRICFSCVHAFISTVQYGFDFNVIYVKFVFRLVHFRGFFSPYLSLFLSFVLKKFLFTFRSGKSILSNESQCKLRQTRPKIPYSNPYWNWSNQQIVCMQFALDRFSVLGEIRYIDFMLLLIN